MLYSKTSPLSSGRWLRGSWTPSLCAHQPSVHLSREQLSWLQLSQLGSPFTVESSRTGVFNWHPLEVQECSPWIFPAAGRYQTLLQLTVLPSAELSSGISERRSSPPHPVSLSDTDRVPSPRSQQQISHSKKLSGRARESAICDSHPFVYSSQVGTHHGLTQGEAFNILGRN